MGKRKGDEIEWHDEGEDKIGQIWFWMIFSIWEKLFFRVASLNIQMKNYFVNRICTIETAKILGISKMEEEYLK